MPKVRSTAPPRSELTVDGRAAGPAERYGSGQSGSEPADGQFCSLRGNFAGEHGVGISSGRPMTRRLRACQEHPLHERKLTPLFTKARVLQDSEWKIAVLRSAMGGIAKARAVILNARSMRLRMAGMHLTMASTYLESLPQTSSMRNRCRLFEHAVRLYRRAADLRYDPAFAVPTAEECVQLLELDRTLATMVESLNDAWHEHLLCSLNAAVPNGIYAAAGAVRDAEGAHAPWSSLRGAVTEFGETPGVQSRP